MPRRTLDPKQPWRAIRMRTVTGVLVGLLLAAVVETAASIAQVRSGPTFLVPLAVLAAFEVGLAVLAFRASRRLIATTDRAIWLLVSLSLLAIASGDGLLAFVLGRGETLAPRIWLFVPPLLIEYAAVTGASILYARRLRGRSDLGWAATEASIAVAFVGVAVWFWLLAPGFAWSGASGDKWAGIALASGDLVGLVAPTLFVSLALLHEFGEGGIQRDWLRLQSWATVAVGFILATGSDIAWYALAPMAPLSSGSLVRFVNIAGHIAVTAGAFLALDAEQPQSRAEAECGGEEVGSQPVASSAAAGPRHQQQSIESAASRVARPGGDVGSESLPWRIVRLRTVMTALGGLVVVAVVQTIAGVSAGNGSELVAQIAAYAGVALEFAIGGLVVAVAVRMRDRVSKRTWLFMGVAVVCVAVSDLDWTYRQGAPLQLATPPETRFVQGALLIAYSCAAVALVAYGLHWKDRSDVRKSAVQMLGVMGLLGGIAWFGVLQPALRMTKIPPADSVGYLTYAAADMLFVIAPTVFVILTVMRVPSPQGKVPDWRLMQPWTTIALGATLIAGSALGWYYRAAVAPWAPGTLLDFFYLTGYVVFGVGVMLASDHEEFLGEQPASPPELER